MADDPPDFVHEMRALGESHAAPTLPDAEQAEVDRRCAELARHRDRALVSGSGYLIGDGSDG